MINRIFILTLGLLLLQVNSQIQDYPLIKDIDFASFINSKVLKSELSENQQGVLKELNQEKLSQSRMNFEFKPISNYYSPESNEYEQGLLMNTQLINLFVGITILIGFIFYMVFIKILKWKKEKKLNRFKKSYNKKYIYTISALLTMFLLMNLICSVIVFIANIKEFILDQELGNIIENNMQKYGQELNSLERLMGETCTSTPKLNEFYIQIKQCQVQPAPKFFNQETVNNMNDMVNKSEGIQKQYNYLLFTFISEVLLFIFILISLGWISFAIRRKLQYQFQLSAYIYFFIAGISFINVYFYRAIVIKRSDICINTNNQIENDKYIIREGFFHYIPLYTTKSITQLRKMQQYNYELTRYNINNYLQNLKVLVNNYNENEFNQLISKSNNIISILKQSADPLYQAKYGDAQSIVNQNIKILGAIKLNNQAQTKFKDLIQHIPTQRMFIEIQKDYCYAQLPINKLAPIVNNILRSFTLLFISILSQQVVNILLVKKLQKYQKQKVGSIRKQLL